MYTARLHDMSVFFSHTGVGGSGLAKLNGWLQNGGFYKILIMMIRENERSLEDGRHSCLAADSAWE